jgi:hypothetical protein
MAPMRSRVFHGCALAHAGVIADPEKQDDFQPEDTVRVGAVFGMVHGSESFCLPPQQLVHEDSHEGMHALRIPMGSFNGFVNDKNNAL